MGEEEEGRGEFATVCPPNCGDRSTPMLVDDVCTASARLVCKLIRKKFKQELAYYTISDSEFSDNHCMNRGPLKNRGP